MLARIICPWFKIVKRARPNNIKCIIFDVDGDVTDIKMTTEELTEESVRARMDALPEPLRTKVKKAAAGRLL